MKIELAFTNDILTGYEEQIGSHWNHEVAADVTRSLVELSTAKLTVAHFNLKLIVNDEDDNKVVDCAFAANADYMVTNDRDFNILKTISFPSINELNVYEFKNLLLEKGILFE